MLPPDALAGAAARLPAAALDGVAFRRGSLVRVYDDSGLIDARLP